MKEYIKIRDLIDYLYNEYELKNKTLEKIEPIKPIHGWCCCCSDCGRFYEECVCTHNEWVDRIKEWSK